MLFFLSKVYSYQAMPPKKKSSYFYLASDKKCQTFRQIKLLLAFGDNKTTFLILVIKSDLRI